MRFIEESTLPEYISTLYEGVPDKYNSFIKFTSSNPDYDGTTSRYTAYKFYERKSLSPDNIQDTLHMMEQESKLSEKNLSMSMCSYKNPYNARKSNIKYCHCVAVDVDYTGIYEGKDPLYMWQEVIFPIIAKISAKGYPIAFPQMIECGHRLKLIYLLEPVNLCIKSPKKKRNTIAILEQISKSITKALNDEDKDLNAEYMSLNKFLRVPGSVNVIYKKNGKKAKSGKNFSYDEKCEFPIYMESNYAISDNIVPERYTLEELAAAALPNREEFERIVAQYKKCKKKEKRKIANVKTLFESRIAVLYKCQEAGYDVGYRETMCFLLWNNLIGLGLERREIEHEVLRFNSNFKTPLPQNGVLKALRPREKNGYKMKDKTFYEMLGIKKGEVMSRRAKNHIRYTDERKEALKDPNSKFNIRIEKRIKAKQMYDEGYKTSEIAKELDCTMQTVRNYIKEDLPDAEKVIQKLEEDIRPYNRVKETIRRVKKKIAENKDKVIWKFTTAFKSAKEEAAYEWHWEGIEENYRLGFINRLTFLREVQNERLCNLEIAQEYRIQAALA